MVFGTSVLSSVWPERVGRDPREHRGRQKSSRSPRPLFRALCGYHAGRDSRLAGISPALL